MNNAVNAAHNGFSIGLSFGDPSLPDTTSPAQGVDDSVRNCEITYGFYIYIQEPFVRNLSSKQ